MSTPTNIAAAKMALALQDKEGPSRLKKLLSSQKIQFSRQGDILRLCYQEGSFNWSELSRASRNTFWFKNQVTQRWEILRMGLERGAEIARPDVENTQDVHKGNLSQFDANQQAVMSAFMEGSELPNTSVLTSKVDGCCLFALFVPASDEPAVSALRKRLGEIQDVDTETFFGIVGHEAFKINENWLPVFGTNGGLFTGPGMVQTWTQAIAGTAGIHLSADKSWQDTLREALPIVLPKMFGLVELIVADNGMTPTRVNLAFEGVLAKRRDVWGKTFHTELVVDYPWSGLSYLGATWGFGETVGTYRPHFEDDMIVSSLGFKQPLFWRIGNSTEKATTMLADLDLLLKGEISRAQFFAAHPPSNEVLPEDQEEWVIDYEGFVLLDFLPSDKEGRWHYSKLKTGLYYKLHKLKLSNFHELLALPLSVADKMPNLHAVHAIKKAMDEGIPALREEVKRILECYFPGDFAGSLRHNSVFTKELEKATNEKHQASIHKKMEGAIAAYTKAFEEKAANQLPILVQNVDTSVRDFHKAFTTAMGFPPKNDEQLKQVIGLLNPRLPFDLDAEMPANGKMRPLKVKLFNAFADAIAKE